MHKLCLRHPEQPERIMRVALEFRTKFRFGVIRLPLVQVSHAELRMQSRLPGVDGKSRTVLARGVVPGLPLTP